MADALKNLKYKRGQLKATITRFVTFMNSNNVETNIFHLKERKENIKSLLSDFDNIQTQIEILEELEVDNQEREEFELNFYNALGLAEQLLAVHVTHACVEKDSNFNGHRLTNADAQLNTQIRLPKIDLPIFHGSYEEWYPFYDTFFSLIHSNNSISNIQKFHYLKSSIKGEAASCLQSLEITSDNYEDAWNILKERYDNKRLIIQKHIKAILELPVTLKENFKDLRFILDGVLKHMRALKSLKRPTETWDDLIVYIISSKLDPTSAKEWEATLSSTEMPTFKEITGFIGKKCQTLESLAKNPRSNDFSSPSAFQNVRQKFKTATHMVTNKSKCPICEESHSVYQCKVLATMSIDRRWKEVKSKRLCINCLRTNHMVAQCTSGSCKLCQRKHNTLLHQEKPLKDNPELVPSTSITNHSTAPLLTHVLLSTAMVKIADVSGQFLNCRALLDSGSQSNLISRKLANRLELPRKRTVVSVSGINQGNILSTESLEAKMQSMSNNFRTKLNFLILDKISDTIPLIPIPRCQIKIPENIQLADPDFHQPREIDLLIGAELFFKLLCVGQLNLGKGQPWLQKTLLGWVVAGNVSTNRTRPSRSVCNFSTNANLHILLAKFWEIEDCSHPRKFNLAENVCENHFVRTHKRTDDGRFIVRLPLKDDVSTLGESRDQALRRFYSLEKRLEKLPQIKHEYTAFLREYLELKHMKLVENTAESQSNCAFYLPHHAVIKEQSATTKLRVVFDGSAKSSSGTSLNDILQVGPKLQEDLFSIVLRFRTFKFVLTADIAKMYRQVLIDPSQTSLQRILWREDKKDEIKTFELTTITYGTAPASFLAIRALQQLAKEEAHEFPKGAEIILRDFYVDDLLTGANTLIEAKQVRDEVISISSRGGFELRKFVSNQPELLANIPECQNGSTILNLDNGEGISMLGLQWNSTADILQYSVYEVVSQRKVTKRIILSSIAKIFDPLGLINPFVITAKILMQQLWQLKLDWDEPVSTHLRTAWLKYESQLEDLKNLKIPRNVIEISQPQVIELHGFCDASIEAYGACIYIKATNQQGISSCNILCAKSKVAPLRSISLPRLELCGAVLLANLMKQVTEAINLKFHSLHYWTDSTIVLNWLKSTSKTWKTFVANRVGEIQQITDPANWRHVSTLDNPADVVSRGCSIEGLIQLQIWWKGPSWLISSSEFWPQPQLNLDDEQMPERRQVTSILITKEDRLDWFSRYSSLDRLFRIFAYCQRFKNNACLPDKLQRQTGPLNVSELHSSRTALLQMAQGSVFHAEISLLRSGQKLDSRSKLLCLNPFLDEKGLLRVGGRLKHADLPEQQKHPVLLPANHPLTELIIRHAHQRHLHSGVQSTLAAVRENYWPLSAKNTIKRIIRKCIMCFKANPKHIEPQMGDLPEKRIKLARPFENVGVDYFGPLQVREGKRRNARTTKAYGAVFVCFVTKAVHLELIGDLTTESFIAALKRFMSRRGKPSNIYSDNGTQFVGAKRELASLKEMLHNMETQTTIHGNLANDGVQWHFIPARSPHFGGLWEAAVKSVKQHLNKVISNTSLNYEELITILNQIEAILNSRPLTPISTDPNDHSFLTPAHFLIGGSLMSIPEPSLCHLKVNNLSRWQYVEQLRQHFWNRWSREYLNTLQSRTKWKSNRDQRLTPGALVLVRDENLRPLSWPTGRILEVFPGEDGIVRVATVRTCAGVFKRAAARLCILPIDS